MHTKYTSGFTLIELSIVLVIIGFIVGGILLGTDLIKAAEVRAQISQIEKYQTAVNTFRTKYGYLPGDIKDPEASSFGFQARGQYPGEGDANGELAGNCTNSSAGMNNFMNGCGEEAVFWPDLSEAHLIDANILGYDTNGYGYPSTIYPVGAYLSGTTPTVTGVIPTAKIGTNNFVYVYGMLGSNYFAVSSVTHVGFSIDSTANPGITVQQASMIDTKIDDGLPLSGNVTVCYENYNIVTESAIYAAGNLLQGPYTNTGNYGYFCNPTTLAIPYAPTNCYDNNGLPGTAQYSLAKNAAIANCALSFKFQ